MKNKWRIEFDGSWYYVMQKGWFFWRYHKQCYQGGGYGPINFSDIKEAVDYINDRIVGYIEDGVPKTIKMERSKPSVTRTK